MSWWWPGRSRWRLGGALSTTGADGVVRGELSGDVDAVGDPAAFVQDAGTEARDIGAEARDLNLTVEPR